MTAIGIACTHSDAVLGGNPDTDFTLCEAKAGEPCNWIDFAGERHPKEEFHPERIVDAAAMTESPDPPSKEDFDRAVEMSGEI